MLSSFTLPHVIPNHDMLSSVESKQRNFEECLCCTASEKAYLCSMIEKRSCEFVTTWGWVNDDRILNLGWSNPLNLWTYESESISWSWSQFSACFLVGSHWAINHAVFVHGGGRFNRRPPSVPQSKLREKQWGSFHSTSAFYLDCLARQCYLKKRECWHGICGSLKYLKYSLIEFKALKNLKHLKWYNKVVVILRGLKFGDKNVIVQFQKAMI